MFESMIPNFEGEEAAIKFVSTKGYVMVVNLRNLTPQYYRSTFPQGWQNRYIANRFALIDPILYWAAWNTGVVRWSEIAATRKIALNDHVMKCAKEYGLNYGAVFSYKTGKSRTSRNIFSVSRDDRDFTDEELTFLETSFNRILGYIGEATQITQAELDVLSLAARGKTQQEIAEMEGISKETVKKRMEKARRTLGANSATHAVAIAISRKLITL